MPSISARQANLPVQLDVVVAADDHQLVSGGDEAHQRGEHHRRRAAIARVFCTWSGRAAQAVALLVARRRRAHFACARPQRDADQDRENRRRSPCANGAPFGTARGSARTARPGARPPPPRASATSSPPMAAGAERCPSRGECRRAADSRNPWILLSSGRAYFRRIVHGSHSQLERVGARQSCHHSL